jgi:hypothetical protein
MHAGNRAAAEAQAEAEPQADTDNSPQGELDLTTDSQPPKTP